MQLICLPHAGGGSQSFRSWPAFLPPEIRVHAPCLPGREERIGEPPVSSIDVLVQSLTAELLPFSNSPYALYGHSMGAFVAFELARSLRRLGANEPVHLFVGAQRGPRLPYPFKVIYHLGDEEFLAGVIERYGETIPQAVLANPEMRKLVVDCLRADFAIVETYCYSDEPPLTCPITVFGGQLDERVEISELEAWRIETSSDCDVHMLPSGHLFLNADRPKLLALIGKALQANLKVKI